MQNQLRTILSEVTTESLTANLSARSIEKYLKLQHLLPIVDVSQSLEFQRYFNGFYRVQRRSVGWYVSYYSLFQKARFEQGLTFKSILERVFETTGRFEPSFSSKMLATINPKMAVLDSIVMMRFGLKLPAWGTTNRLDKICKSYENLTEILQDLVNSKEWVTVRSMFNEAYPEASQITSIKKLDFVLWGGIAKRHPTPLI